jgi:hypothetical protein
VPVILKLKTSCEGINALTMSLDMSKTRQV